MPHQFVVGEAQFDLEVTPDGNLASLGAPLLRGVALRNAKAPWRPWFDSYDGNVFRSLLLRSIEKRGEAAVVRTRAVSDNDWPFQERRDSSGDITLRSRPVDAPPAEADFSIVFEPAKLEIDGRSFTGFKYWFEYESADVPIHRLLDRQTWELGGNLNDVTVVCRNLFDLPRKKLSREATYSTVGLDNYAGLLPGNLWGRWTLLPGFDLQYGKSGTLLGLFDQVSNIRSVIESTKGEDALRIHDFHYFTNGRQVKTNPKTILWSQDVLSDLDALNLWTRLQDRDYTRVREQFGFKEDAPPAVIVSHNQWQNFKFDSSYEKTVDLAAEFGADYVFIDVFWENGEAFRQTLEELIPAEKWAGTVIEKKVLTHMCITLDFEVAKVFGGEEGLRNLVQRAKAKGVNILGWMSTHYDPLTYLQNDKSLGHGSKNIFATKESGLHPDTGYASDCWPANLNAPIFDKIRAQLLGVCQRTGVAGFLWDSFSNLGWWQVDYSKGDFRPQFDRTAKLYADLTNAGLYLMPEAVVSFSKHSCCGLHGGNVYAGDLLGYAYNTNIGLEHGGKDVMKEILTGNAPFSLLFHSFAHLRIPNLSLHTVPRDQWHAPTVQKIKTLLKLYRKCRHLMVHRTVLDHDYGVIWSDLTGAYQLLWAFKAHVLPERATELLSGDPAKDAKPEGVYLLV